MGSTSAHIPGYGGVGDIRSVSLCPASGRCAYLNIAMKIALEWLSLISFDFNTPDLIVSVEK